MLLSAKVSYPDKSFRAALPKLNMPRSGLDLEGTEKTKKCHDCRRSSRGTSVNLLCTQRTPHTPHTQHKSQERHPRYVFCIYVCQHSSKLTTHCPPAPPCSMLMWLSGGSPPKKKRSKHSKQHLRSTLKRGDGGVGSQYEVKY